MGYKMLKVELLHVLKICGYLGSFLPCAICKLPYCAAFLVKPVRKCMYTNVFVFRKNT